MFLVEATMSSISPCILFIAIFLSLPNPFLILLKRTAISAEVSSTADALPSRTAEFKTLISSLKVFKVVFISPTSNPCARSSSIFSTLVAAGFTLTVR